MPLIKCKDCGTEVSTSAKACPKCGAKVPRTKWWLWVPVGLIVAFIGFGSVVGNTPEAQQRDKERRVIERCWEDYKIKSLDPGTQRFVAGVCEKMESEFMAKHGRKP